MDWLEGMNSVIDYIESNLNNNIDYNIFGKILCCSTYEFSRIFSFITGMSISEYIRRRKLSQAALDIQSSKDKIIDIALKYGYESQSAFTRAFKDMHGQKPLSARKNGVSLKTYPKISLALIIKGVNEMNFRIEKMDSFKIIGYKCKDCSTAWKEFMNHYNKRLRNNNNPSYYTSPFWQVGAYSYEVTEDELPWIIGAELKVDVSPFDDMEISVVPSAVWVVFTITCKSGSMEAGETYTRINTEWFPNSKYKRNTKVPHLEVYPPGNANSDEYKWEIWMPIL